MGGGDGVCLFAMIKMTLKGGSSFLGVAIRAAVIFVLNFTAVKPQEEINRVAPDSGNRKSPSNVFSEQT